MKCPKCGKENPDDAQLCRSCSWVLTSVSTIAPAPDARTSKLAIAAVVLAILSIPTLLITAIPAFICGIVGLVKIEKSTGQLKGKGLAIAGIVILAVSPFIAAVILAILIPPFKDRGNRAEAMRAMEHLGRTVLQYRKEHGSVPPESYIGRVREDLPGNVRLGDVRYRGMWIDFESSGDEILAYAEKRYPSSFLRGGFVVLRLDGRVEWMDKQEFETLLAQQQSPMEIEMLRK